MPVKWATIAEKELELLGVKIIKKTKIIGFSTLRNGSTEINLSNGETRVAELFLNTFGVFPNTSFLPKDLLNENLEVVVDEYLRVESTTNLWAAGDVSNAQGKQFPNAESQAHHLAKNLDLVLKGKTPIVFNRKPLGKSFRLSIGSQTLIL